MKYKIIALLIAFASISCNTEKEGNLQLSGNIKGFYKGTIYIQKLEDTTLVMMDSIAVNGDSKFQSSLQIDSPEMLYLFLDRGVSKNIDNSLPFFAEPGKINIDANLENFFAKAKITGSKNQDLYEEFKKVKLRFTNQELTFTEAELNAFKDNKELASDHEQKYSALVKKRYLYAINFALNNKNFDVAPYVTLSEIADANIKYLDTIQRSMSPEVANGKYGKMLTKYVTDLKPAK